jgi:hypothetical protein
MRKIALGFTLLTLLVLVGSALSSCALQAGATPTPEATPIPGSTAVTATLRTYYEPTGHFTIGYPPDWEITEGNQYVEFVEPYGKLHILVQYTDAGQVLDETMMRVLISSYFTPGDSNEASTFKQENETVYSDGSILVEYSYDTAGAPIHGSSMFQQEGTFLYILSFWVEGQDLWAPNEAFFNTVSRTFMPTAPAE